MPARSKGSLQLQSCRDKSILSLVAPLSRLEPAENAIFDREKITVEAERNNAPSLCKLKLQTARAGAEFSRGIIQYCISRSVENSLINIPTELKHRIYASQHPPLSAERISSSFQLSFRASGEPFGAGNSQFFGGIETSNGRTARPPSPSGRPNLSDLTKRFRTGLATRPPLSQGGVERRKDESNLETRGRAHIMPRAAHPASSSSISSCRRNSLSPV